MRTVLDTACWEGDLNLFFPGLKTLHLSVEKENTAFETNKHESIVYYISRHLSEGKKNMSRHLQLGTEI